MSLYLVQHGKSLSKQDDPEKGLSPVGTAETERIAAVAAGYGVPVARIVHSGKKRARQTAELYAAAVKPEGGTVQAQGIGPLDDVAGIGRELSPQSNVMVVGHLPFLSRLTAWLITGSTDKTIFQFQNSGIVCLDQEADTGGWIIKWALMPMVA